MKKFILFFVSSLLILNLSACSQPEADAIDARGNAIRLADYENKWIFVNYWATWCKPCIEELPALNQFNNKHKDKDAVVLGVNFDGIAPQAMLDFTKNLSIDFPLLQQFPLQKFQLKQPSVLPTTYIINAKGQLEQTLLGPQDEASLEAALLALKRKAAA